MAGEMSQSEVTRESYPGLFALRDALRRRGITSEPRAFDQYQGPYLFAGGCKVWYSDSYYVGHGPVANWRNGRDDLNRPLKRVDLFVIQRDRWEFETEGAREVLPAHERNGMEPDSVTHGIYTLRQAAKRIAEVVK